MAHGPDGRLHALAGHHAAELEDHALLGRQPEDRAGQALVHRAELVGVEAAGDDGDARGVGLVEADEVLLVLRALGDHAVGLPDHPVLDGEALVGEFVGLPLVQAAHPAERVEGDDERDAERALWLGRHQARHPEVRVNEVVAPSAGRPPAG